MSDAYTDLATVLSDGDFSKQLVDVENWIRELVPDLDVQSPVLRAMLIQPIAARQAMNDNAAAVLRDYSLLSKLPIDSIADDTTRNAVRQLQLQEHGLDTVPASAALGEVKLTFNSNNPVVIPTGTSFSTGAVSFRVSDAFILKSELGAPSGNASERVFRAEGDNWVTTIPVSAIQTGQAGNIPAGTSMTVPSGLTGLVQVQAVSNFVGGRDAVDLGELVTTFFDNRVQKSLGSRDQVVALIRSRSDLASVRQVGVVGFGDPEMHRDKDRFIPGGGGKTDLYVASGNFPSTIHYAVKAVPIARPDSGNQRYSVEIPRDAAPGFLEVESVHRTDTQVEFALKSTIRGTDTRGILGEQVPKILEVSQGTFSRYQTATLIVEDPEVESSPSNTEEIQLSVALRYLPGIASLQSLVSARETRYVAGDTLVRAACPLMLAMVIHGRSTEDDQIPDSEQLQAAVLSEISREPMRSAIYASDVIAAMSPFIRPTLSITRVEFYGRIITPDGKTVNINGVDELQLPNDPTNQLTPRTIAIYSTPTLIRFTVERLLSAGIP